MTELAPLRTIVMPPGLDGRTMPLQRCLVLLHGYGANASDLLLLQDELAPDWTAVAIEAPVDLGPMGLPGGRAWFHLAPSPDGSISVDMAGATQAVGQLVSELPQAVAAAGFSMDDTVIMGFSQGAMLGHALLLREHLPMRGLAACSARMIPEIMGQGGGVRDGLPVFLSHGTHDGLIPVHSGHELRDFYTSQTPAAVTWCEEPIGHGIGPQMAEALRAWFATVA